MNTKTKKTVGEITYNSKNIGFSITIPDNWMEVKKSSYQDLGINDNTLFTFSVDKFTSLSAIFSGFCKTRDFNQFFEKVKFNKSLEVLTTSEKEINGLRIKCVVIDYSDKKILNAFCLINGMLINFTINVDYKNRLFDNKGLLNDKNAKLLFKILETIKISKPLNPPIYVNDYVKEPSSAEEVEPKEIVKKTTAQETIETDCKYRHILMPDFYIRYNLEEDDSSVVLSVINREVYFNDSNDNYRFIKVDEKVSSEIKEIISTNIDTIMDMDMGYEKPKNNSNLLVKLGERVALIDLIGNDVLRSIFAEIFSVIKGDNVPKEEKHEPKPVVDIKMPAKDEEKEKEFILPIAIEPKEEIKPEVEEVHDEIKEEPQEEIHDEIKEEELQEEEVHDEVKEEEPQEEKEEPKDYDLTNYEEYLHNVDGHASFKFLFPSGSGEKVIRDFNVFDIVKDEELAYRVFIFKCDTVDKYEEKLSDWMNKNTSTADSELVNTYENTSANGLNIKTYILKNNRFYKVIYKEKYLIAISSFAEEDKLYYADLALENVEIGGDNKEYVESYERKMNSINILKSQGIPYIDELPVLPSSYEVKGKTLDEIAKRSIVLCICCNYANDVISNKKKRYLKESKKFFNKLLDKFMAKDIMTKEEKELFDKGDKNLAIQISWQFEGCAILLWTLGLIEDVEFPDTLVEPDYLTSIVSSCESYKEFIEKCGLRDVNEVLDLADLTYRYNWYCVDAQINEEEPIINPEVVMERHRALKWLLSDEEWDKVEINT